MKMKSQAICTGIKESSGTFEETKKAFSSTTFHLIVDVAENSAGRSIGSVSRPFKFGDATEFEKWAHLDKSWPATGLVPLSCAGWGRARVGVIAARSGRRCGV
ncbi:MAG: hypothetical protein JF626_14500 [Polaromonas sp.]|nr:hypothetical protein [Polaromonas sp.]